MPPPGSQHRRRAAPAPPRASARAPVAPTFVRASPRLAVAVNGAVLGAGVLSLWASMRRSRHPVRIFWCTFSREVGDFALRARARAAGAALLDRMRPAKPGSPAAAAAAAPARRADASCPWLLEALERFSAVDPRAGTLCVRARRWVLLDIFGSPVAMLVGLHLGLLGALRLPLVPSGLSLFSARLVGGVFWGAFFLTTGRFVLPTVYLKASRTRMEDLIPAQIAFLRFLEQEERFCGRRVLAPRPPRRLREDV